MPGTKTEDYPRIEAIASRLKKSGAKQVFLFGSTAHGKATPDSDIDLLVILPTDKKLHLRGAFVLESVRDLSYRLPLSPIVLTPEELKNRLKIGDQFVQEILATGIEF